MGALARPLHLATAGRIPRDRACVIDREYAVLDDRFHLTGRTRQDVLAAVQMMRRSSSCASRWAWLLLIAAASFAALTSSAASPAPPSLPAFGPCATKPDCKGKDCCKHNDYKRLEMAIADAEFRAVEFEDNSRLLDPGNVEPQDYQSAVEAAMTADIPLLQAQAVALGFPGSYVQPPQGETSCLGGARTVLKYPDGNGNDVAKEIAPDQTPEGGINDVVAAATNAYKGSGTPLEGICREQISATLAHEGTHRARCKDELKLIKAASDKYTDLGKKLGVQSLGQKVAYRDDEARAYHAEAEHLREIIRQSLQRCCPTCKKPKKPRGDTVAESDAALMTELLKRINAMRGSK
jgi:hypothetical protein